jgi:hypothetical protein
VDTHASITSISLFSGCGGLSLGIHAALGHVEPLQWPTPRTLTGGPESAERKQDLGRTESGGGDLQSAAGGGWGTPTSRDWKDGSSHPWDRNGRGDNGSVSLQAPNWGTPRVTTNSGIPCMSREGNEKSRLEDQAGSFASAAASSTPEIMSARGAGELWPTATAHDATGARGSGNFLNDHHYKPHDLAMAGEKRKTPNVPNGGRVTRPGEMSLTGSKDGKKAQVDLQYQATEIDRQWQTPATDSFRSRGGDRKDEMGLDQEARRWPTPTANDDNKTPKAHLAMKKRMGERDGTNSNRTAITSLQVTVQTNTIATPTFPSSPPAHPAETGPESLGAGLNCLPPSQRKRLNPLFVEWLQGIPPGWTDPTARISSEALETWFARLRHIRLSWSSEEGQGSSDGGGGGNMVHPKHQRPPPAGAKDEREAAADEPIGSGAGSIWD